MTFRVLVACGLLAGLLIAGCSSDSSDSSSETSTTTTTAPPPVPRVPPVPEVCASRSKLEKSVKQLVDPSTLTGGKRGFRDAVDAVKSDLDTLSAAAKNDVQPDVTAVKDAVDELQITVDDLGSGSITDGLQNVGNAFAKVGSTAGNVVTSLQPSCSS